MKKFLETVIIMVTSNKKEEIKIKWRGSTRKKNKISKKKTQSCGPGVELACSHGNGKWEGHAAGRYRNLIKPVKRQHSRTSLEIDAIPEARVEKNRSRTGEGPWRDSTRSASALSFDEQTRPDRYAVCICLTWTSLNVCSNACPTSGRITLRIPPKSNAYGQPRKIHDPII